MICCIRSLNRTDTRTGSLLQVICFSSPKYTGINSNNNKNTLLLCEQIHVQYSHREIPISPARLGDTFCCLGDFLSFHRDNRYSQRDAQVTQRDVVTVHRA